MNIGILGTGGVGQTLAAKLIAAGHSVVIGTRDVTATAAKPEFKLPAQAKLATFAEAAAHGALLINVLSGHAAIEGLKSAGEANLGTKPLMDVSNPLDFSKGMPPSLLVANHDSLGEQIQRAFPKARVVKTLNTITAALMVAPQSLAGGDHTMFVCGNESGAKAEVTKLLKEAFGWKDVVDLGDLSNARATEMLVVLWARLYGVLKTPSFGFKVVR